MYSINPFRIKVATFSDFDERATAANFFKPPVRALGYPLNNIRPGLRRYFQTVLAPVEPSFEGSILLEQYKGFPALLKTASKIRGMLEESGLEQGLLEAELDNITKITVLNGNSGSNHIEPEGFVTDHKVTLTCLEDLSEWLTGLLPKTREGLNLTTARGTNHGWPTYMSGAHPYNSVDMLVHVRLATMLRENAQGDLSEFESYIKSKTGIAEPLAASMFFRRQPTSKPTHIYRLMNDGPSYLRSEEGKWCRLRQVFGVPLFINSLLREPAQLIKKGYRSMPNFDHTTADRTLKFVQSFKDFTFFSEDISGYDKSVSYDMQMQVADKIYSRFMSDVELNVYRQSQALPIMSPPLTSVDDGFLYKRKGQTISGSIFTDKDGSLFNFVRILESIMAAMGWSAGIALSQLNKTWTCLVFGDDCVIGWSNSLTFDRDRYFARTKDLGFKTEPFEGIVFLMNYFNRSRNVYHGILSRALDKTVNKEYTTIDPVLTVFGDYARWARLVEHPLFNEGFQGILDMGWHPRQGIRSIADLRRAALSSSSVRYLEQYGQKSSARAAMRDMLAGLTHGSLDMTDLANINADGLFLSAVERLLVGLEDDEIKLQEQASRLSERNLMRYITWSITQQGKPPIAHGDS